MENKFTGDSSAPGVNVESITLFAELLLKSREARKKTRRGIAKEIGVAYQMIQNWESGDFFPTEDKLPIIAEAYGINPQELDGVFRVSKEDRERAKEGRKR